ncbi:MAG: LytR/AlgR family response regulator transcription factor, partial [Marinicella sp.]
LKPDLLFLDINMPKYDGFSLFKKEPADEIPLVVFVTAYAEYAVKGFEKNAVDYLLKPVSQERLAACLQMARQRLHEKKAVNKVAAIKQVLNNDINNPLLKLKKICYEARNHESIFIGVSIHNNLTKINTNDILAIEAAGNYVCVLTPQTTHVCRITMKKILTKLNPQQFFRIHRSVIINRECVEAMTSLGGGRFKIKLSNQQIYHSSKSMRQQVKLMSSKINSA